MLPVDEPADEAKCEDLEKIIVGDDPEKFFLGWGSATSSRERRVVELLKRNVHMFIWNAYEALGVDPSFIYHHLNVNPSVTPRKQPPRRSYKDYSDAVKDEVIKLK